MQNSGSDTAEPNDAGASVLKDCLSDRQLAAGVARREQRGSYRLGLWRVVLRAGKYCSGATPLPLTEV